MNAARSHPTKTIWKAIYLFKDLACSFLEVTNETSSNLVANINRSLKKIQAGEKKKQQAKLTYTQHLRVKGKLLWLGSEVVR